MNAVLKIISFSGLVLTVLPSVLMFHSKINFQQHADYMLLGTILWFVTAPFWIGKENKNKI